MTICTIYLRPPHLRTPPARDPSDEMEKEGKTRGRGTVSFILFSFFSQLLYFRGGGRSLSPVRGERARDIGNRIPKGSRAAEKGAGRKDG
jgi:hypothetical protein